MTHGPTITLGPKNHTKRGLFYLMQTVAIYFAIMLAFRSIIICWGTVGLKDVGLKGHHPRIWNFVPLGSRMWHSKCPLYVEKYDMIYILIFTQLSNLKVKIRLSGSYVIPLMITKCWKYSKISENIQWPAIKWDSHFDQTSKRIPLYGTRIIDLRKPKNFHFKYISSFYQNKFIHW